jgi:two-component system, OmpR family, alkaline phosphatase synthesis response regulator PhoP
MKIIDDIQILAGKKPDPRLVQKAPPPKVVLVVEDEKPLAAILETRLAEEGFHVIKAANGEEGLNLALEHKPNVIVLDLLMPVMDGKSMLRKLRETPECKNIPVIVLTNAGEIDNVRDTQFFSDAIEFLIKSNVSMEQIVSKVKMHTLGTPLTTSST